MSAHNSPMKWYYKVLGGHTHVRVFMNGAKCGDLCFRNEEFADLKSVGSVWELTDFINESLPEQPNE